MIAAMMLPLIVPMVRHVAVRSFAARRERAVGTFVLGYLLIWLLVGLAMWLALPALRQGLAYLGLADHGGLIACSLAALWQISPAKRRAVNRCHRTLPLHAVGFAADRDAMTFGLLLAGRCVAVCLPAMAAPLLGSAGLVGMLAVLAVLLAERARRAPQYRLSAVVLLLVGLIG
jgi:hypothetical protein